MAAVRKTLKSFSNIADPGADRVLLFAGIAPIAAIPSNCPYVLVRIQDGRERENYGATYKEAQRLIVAEVPENFAARCRAYLLLKRHGQEVCKSVNPKCQACPIRVSCAFFSGGKKGDGLRACMRDRGTIKEDREVFRSNDSEHDSMESQPGIAYYILKKRQAFFLISVYHDGWVRRNR